LSYSTIAAAPVARADDGKSWPPASFVGRRVLGGRAKMRMKLIGAAILAAMALTLAGPAHAQQKERHFAYLTPGLDLPFWRYLAVGISDEAKKHNATVTDYDSHNDAATQLKNAQDAIARNVDGILISPTDSSTAPSVLGLAEKANIPVVIADIGTVSGNYVSFIISDNERGAHDTGVALAAALKDHHWDQGPVGLVTISLARNNGKARTKGFRDAMKENGDIKEVALDQMQRYTADETFKYVQDMLTAHPDLHAIFVQTDTPTLGAVRAIQLAHREDSVLLAAYDGVPEFIDLIRQGKIVASGMQQPYLMGVRSAQAMFDHLDGKTPDKEILVPIIVVSQKNLDEVLPTITQTVFANELKK
jgi:ABC-type sugar transport system substrate-binding protein